MTNFCSFDILRKAGQGHALRKLRKKGDFMATAGVQELKFLQEYGFSEKQAEGILQVMGAETEKTEKKIVTREYLELKLEKMKNYLIVQAVGIVLASLGLLGWYINYLDNKNRAYVEARFSKIESDLKDIKTFIFSHSSVAIGGAKNPPKIDKQ